MRSTIRPRDLAVTVATSLLCATVLLGTVETGSRHGHRSWIPPSGAITHAAPDRKDPAVREYAARIRADRRSISDSNTLRDFALPPRFTPVRDWILQPRMTYDSAGGWWTSESLGVNLYFDSGMEQSVGRYVRAGNQESVAGDDVRWELRPWGTREPWIFATIEDLDSVTGIFESKRIVNLASERNPMLDERTQLAHMLWCATNLSVR